MKNPHLFIEEYITPITSVQIPQNWSVKVRDYHEFRARQLAYQDIGINAKYEEVGCDGQYEAIFWVGKKPIRLIEAVRQAYHENE